MTREVISATMLRLTGVVVISMCMTGCDIHRSDGLEAERASLNQMPEAVQATIVREARHGRFVDLGKASLDGRPVFTVTTDIDDNEQELLIDEDGKVLGRLAVNEARFD